MYIIVNKAGNRFVVGQGDIYLHSHLQRFFCSRPYLHLESPLSEWVGLETWVLRHNCQT